MSVRIYGVEFPTISDVFELGQEVSNPAKNYFVTTKKISVKFVDLTETDEFVQLLNEIKYLRRLKLLNQIEFESAFVVPGNKMALKFDFEIRGSLADVNLTDAISDDFAGNFAKWIYHLLDLFDSYDMAHRNINPENVVYLEDGSFRLINYIHAVDLRIYGEVREKVGLSPWLAPEIENYVTMITLPSMALKRSDLWSATKVLEFIAGDRKEPYTKIFEEGLAEIWVERATARQMIDILKTN